MPYAGILSYGGVLGALNDPNSDNVSNIYLYGSGGTGKPNIVQDSYGNFYVVTSASQSHYGSARTYGIDSDNFSYGSASSTVNTYRFSNEELYDILLIKFNSQFQIQWQTLIGSWATGNHNSGEEWVNEKPGIATDGTSVWIGWQERDSFPRIIHNKVQVAKFATSNGALNWHKVIENTDDYLLFGGLDIDSSGNSYVTFWGTGTNGDDCYIVKLNSSGTTQWQRAFGGSQQDKIYDSVTDSSGNTYTVGLHNYFSASSPYYDWSIGIAKYNSSGTQEWYRAFGDSNYPGSGNSNPIDRGYAIALDDTESNIAVTGETAGNKIIVAKYNSSGTIQWYKTYKNEQYSNSGKGRSVVFDPDGNIFVLAITNAFYSNTMVGLNDAVGVILKFNSSGALQFQNYVNFGIGTNETKITASDGAQFDSFGASVAVGNNKIVVGAPNDINSGLSFAGAVYVYDLDGTNEVKIIDYDAANAAINDNSEWGMYTGYRFGSAVAVGSNKIVVGSWGDDDKTGAIYVYDLDGNSDFNDIKITASDGAAGDQFGSGEMGQRSVAIDNKTGRIVVAAYKDDDNGSDSGSIYVYDLSDKFYANNYGEIKITASDGGANEWFGHQVAIDNNKIVVASRYNINDNESTTGAIYVYDLSNSANNYGEIKITASDGAAYEDGSLFGRSVDIDNNKIVVGSGGTTQDHGAVYVYDLDGTNEVKITASDGASGDAFGDLVAVGSNKIVVTNPNDSDRAAYSGAVYVYNLDGTNEVKINASDGGQFGYLGEYGVGIDNNKIVVGAYQDEDNGWYAGAVYAFDLDDNEPFWGSLISNNRLYIVGRVTGHLCIMKIPLNESALGISYIPPNTNSDLLDISFDYFGLQRPVTNGSWNGYYIGNYGSEYYNSSTQSVNGNSDYHMWKKYQLDSTSKTDRAANQSGSGYTPSLTIRNLNLTFVNSVKQKHHSNDMQLHFDARNNSSWPGIGSTWTDISGNGNNETKIFASDAQSGDLFGVSVAVGNNKIVVGAVGEDTYAFNSGAVYVYDLDGTNEVKIIASDAADANWFDGYSFGSAVAVGSNKIVVGSSYYTATGDETGAIYVYDLDGTNEIKITASDGADGDGFGSNLTSDTVAIDNKTGKIVVSAYEDHNSNGTDSGAIYVYDLSNSANNYGEIKIIASDGVSYERFGHEVAIDNNKIVVAPRYSNRNSNFTDSDSIYVYDLSNSANNYGEIKITASDGSSFGRPVAIDNNKIVVVGGGSVYVYDLSNSANNYGEIKITASSGDSFGSAVAVGSNKIVVAAPQASYSRSIRVSDSKMIAFTCTYAGAVYVYDLDGTNEVKITASDSDSYDFLGRFGVGIDNSRIFVGAYGDDDKGSWAGTVYAFDLDRNFTLSGATNGTQAVIFDGSDDFGYQESNSSWMPHNFDNFAIEMYADDIVLPGSNQFNAVLSKAVSSNSNDGIQFAVGFYTTPSPSVTYKMVAVANATGSNNIGSWNTTPLTFDITNIADSLQNGFNQFVWSYEGNSLGTDIGKMHFYINGEKVATFENSSNKHQFSNDNSNADLRLADSLGDTSSDHHFQGKIRLLRMYSKHLGLREVNMNYQNCLKQTTMHKYTFG